MSAGHSRLLRSTRLGAPLLLLLLLPILVGGREPQGEHSPIRRAEPHEAELIVTVRGVGICSGAPIEHTRMVVTAAHCLLDPRTGDVSTRHDLRVERDGIRYDIETIIIDPASTVEQVIPARDAAVLVLSTRVHGPGVDLRRQPAETRSHATGQDAGDRGVVLIGNQPVDTTGRFHRGREYHDRKAVDGGSPGAVYIGHVPAACDASDTTERKGFLTYRCGMVPGGSGGPVLERDTNTLVGIISSVNRTLTWNGVTPVEEILRLIERAERFTVDLRTSGDAETPDGGPLR